MLYHVASRHGISIAEHSIGVWFALAHLAEFLDTQVLRHSHQISFIQIVLILSICQSMAWFSPCHTDADIGQICPTNVRSVASVTPPL
jgi:hypothetical protein